MTESDLRAATGFVYLASQSPRRQQLLDQIGVAHRPLLPGAEEDAEALEASIPGEAPDAYVERVTRAKLTAAVARLRRRGLTPAPVLCADTTVALGDRILGKPRDPEDAATMLRSLAGRVHRVVTGVAIGTQEKADYRHSVSQVTFAAMSEADIERYVATSEPFGKAGAYAIQGRAAVWIARVDGTGSGVMGLPLYETAQLLRAAGIDV